MRRTPIALLYLVGSCGDNLHANLDAAPLVLDTPAATCLVQGGTVMLRQIAFGCQVIGAPATPQCMASAVVLVTSPPNDDRLFALELTGRIRILDHEQVLAEPFLDLSASAGGPVVSPPPLSELGLLGLAFHPAYAMNASFFVYYTANNPDATDTVHPYVDVVARYTRSSVDPDRADPASGVVVLSIPDPFSNHNGGMIEFGNDGYLYISIGDGGSAPGANGRLNAQDPNSLLGKILRIDVDRKDPGKEYGIPADNPFAAGIGGAKEVFIRGLRNPWRWSFDRATGDMWIGDVGEADFEEIDMLPAGQQAGKNLGWAQYEGNGCFMPPCDPSDKTFPIDTRSHAIGWWAIIGGQVYRGGCYPDLVGTYLYTDCGYGHMTTAKPNGDGSFRIEELPGDFIGGPTSLHAAARGELYETDTSGNIFQIVVVP